MQDISIQPEKTQETVKATDPVCGMSVTLGKGKPTMRYKGQDYQFCNPKCHDRFETDSCFHLSGNSKKKMSGDRVTGGTLNKTGTFTMEAELVSADTLLAKIVDMVASAQRSRAPIQGLADRVSGYFVPTVVGVLLSPMLAAAETVR